jgi:hypothetical protein
MPPMPGQLPPTPGASEGESDSSDDNGDSSNEHEYVLVERQRISADSGLKDGDIPPPPPPTRQD